MKKVLRVLLTTLGVLAVIGGMIAVLMNNKAKSDAKAAKRDVLTTLPVSVATVERKSVPQNLSLVGTIAPNNEVTVLSETSGRVISLTAEVGQYKSKGSPIAKVDDELKRAAVTTAQVNLEKAQSDLARYEQLIKEQAIPEQQVEGARLAVRAAQAQLVTASRLYRDTRITAPASGVVTVRHISPGSTLAPGTPILQLVDISQLKVRVNVSERDVIKLAPGDRVEVTSDLYPGIVFNGTIRNINAKSDEAHTYPVEISLINSSEHPLRAGMFARVSFVTLPKSDALLIPRTAIVGSIQKPQVYVVAAGKAQLRDVEVGGEVGTSVQIVKGLMQGDQVVVDGQNNLTNGAAVSIVK